MERSASYSGVKMTIPYRIVIGEPLTSRQRKHAAHLIKETFGKVDAVYNNWNPSSELSKLNRAGADAWHPVSPDLEKLLLFTNRIVSETGGLFDPTIEPLRKLWRKKLEQGLLPSKEEIAAISERIGWQKLAFRPGFVMKKQRDVEIDLGGIAKGYCVDLLLEKLQEEGYKNLYVEWGGEIRTAGEHPEKRPWHIFISRLQNQNPEEAIAYLFLQDDAVATSGDYLQNWEVAGVRYSHLLSPNTLAPTTIKPGCICSVTVKAKTCALADAFATTAMLFNSLEEAEAWAKKIQETYPDSIFWIVTRN